LKRGAQLLDVRRHATWNAQPRFEPRDLRFVLSNQRSNRFVWNAYGNRSDEPLDLRAEAETFDFIAPALNGRPRVSDRACLTGIVFILCSGIPWQMLPQELECGSGMTCWRRLRDWQLAGVWDLIHFALLDWLARYDRIDWSRAVVDSCTIRAVYGGEQTAPILPIGPSAGASAI
jgi:transposase